MLRTLRVPRTLVLVVVLALALVGIYQWNRDTSVTAVKAYFTSAEGLNVGDDVRVLGVRVGQITSIANDERGVAVEMEVDGSQPIPADARAAIVSPSLVSGRFVQFEPVYTGGATLSDGAVIDVAKTAVPVTFDDVKQQLTDLATTLGPEPGRSEGPLSDAIVAMEKSLQQGNADDLRSSITELRSAAKALSEPRSDLFSTIANLNTFTKNLAVNDAALRGFTTELDGVSTVLAANRKNLSGALSELGKVLKDTDRYFAKNGKAISGSVADLTELSATIADSSDDLAGVLHVGPHALIGLHNTVQDQAITGRATLSAIDDASSLVCGLVVGAGGTAEQCTAAIRPILDLLGLKSTSDLSKLPLSLLGGSSGGTR